MDSAWNQGGKDNSPLKPGEVDNDFEEKGHQKARGKMVSLGLGFRLVGCFLVG